MWFNEILADIGISQGEAVAALVAAGSTAIVALVTKLLKAPDQIKALQKSNDMAHRKAKRLFRKVRVLEDWIITYAAKEDLDVTDIKANQRSESDARDAAEEDDE